MADIRDQLVKHLQEAHAMEQNVLRMLDSMSSSSDEPTMVDALEHHKSVTEQQLARLETCLRTYDESPSTVKEAGGILGAMLKMPLDAVRGEQAGRHARDAYATEHLEIASYELLERVARRAGDMETAQVAAQNCEEERAMARIIEQNWDLFADLSLREAGVAASA